VTDEPPDKAGEHSEGSFPDRGGNDGGAADLPPPPAWGEPADGYGGVPSPSGAYGDPHPPPPPGAYGAPSPPPGAYGVAPPPPGGYGAAPPPPGAYGAPPPAPGAYGAAPWQPPPYATPPQPPWASAPTPYGYVYGSGYPPPPSPYTPYGYAPGSLDRFGRQLAGWWQRVGALVIDGLLIGIPALVLWGIVNSATNTTTCNAFNCQQTSDGWIAWLIVLIAEFAYFSLMDGRGQTVGKLLFGIAVRDEITGQPIGPGRAFGRWFIYVVLWYLLFVPGLLNALSPLWDSKNQAWHDHAVGSLVVKLR
jgi:uncharacterized RDD family membrane protein YckC